MGGLCQAMGADFCLVRNERQEVSVQRTKAEGSMGQGAPLASIPAPGFRGPCSRQVTHQPSKEVTGSSRAWQAYALTCGGRSLSVGGRGFLTLWVSIVAYFQYPLPPTPDTPECRVAVPGCAGSQGRAETWLQ